LKAEEHGKMRPAICGVPAGATAYSVNVAVVPPGPLGYLTLWPTGQSRPIVATLNSLDGRVKSNAATVARRVTYQVTKASGANAGAVPICELPDIAAFSAGWSCTNSAFPGINYSRCATEPPSSTAADGTFTDRWSLESDAWVPAGSGESLGTDIWFWRASSSVTKPLGTLTGWSHTDAVSINGVLNPPNTLPAGTVILK